MISTINTVRERASRLRFALLVTALLGLIAGAPAVGNDPGTEAGIATLFSIVVLGLSTMSHRITLAVCVAGLWLWLTWLMPFGSGVAGEIAEDLALILLLGVAIEGALTHALRAKTVDREAVCAVLAAFLLLGIGWAALYTMMETLTPGSFELTAQHAESPWSVLLYFSFATQTTAGYGDVLPISGLARGISNVQAVTSTFFIAVVVARLVSVYGMQTDGSV